MTSLRTYVRVLGDLVLALRGVDDREISTACWDSRKAIPGSLFCAVGGAREDGADYARDALAHGAAAVVAERLLDLPETVPQIVVCNGYIAAGRIAELAAGYPARDLCLLGITGTNGKTTTAYILRAILRQAKRKCGMLGTVVYDLGKEEIPADRTTPTPFDLQNLLLKMRTNKVEDVVTEVSSHALSQHRLGQARFAGAIFTNLTGDHLDYHKDMAGYYEAKQILFTELLTESAPAVINTDDSHGRQLATTLKSQGREVSTFGTGAEADACISNLKLSFAGISFHLTLGGKSLALSSPLIGRHNAENIAGAALLGHRLGISTDDIAAAVKNCPGAPGRLEAVHAAAGFTAYVDYAHTDDALKNVLIALRALSPRKLIVLFGCGGDRDRSKRPRMAAVAATFADQVILTSDNSRRENPEAILNDLEAGIPSGTNYARIADRRSAIEFALSQAQAGDLLLIAGKGHENYQEINGVKHHFSDLEELRRHLD